VTDLQALEFIVVGNNTVAGMCFSGENPSTESPLVIHSTGLFSSDKIFATQAK